jgi:hypothetical protein
MTTEQFTEELLYKSHSLGIKDDVFELSKQLREDNPTLDFYGSIEKAFYKLTETKEL